jgi:hypothetical protein
MKFEDMDFDEKLDHLKAWWAKASPEEHREFIQKLYDVWGQEEFLIAFASAWGCEVEEVIERLTKPPLS